MTRREILKYTSLVTGGAIGVPLMTSIMSGCHEAQAVSEDYLPQHFSVDDYDLLSQIVDIILPKTDSPAATEVGVPQLIDRMVAEVYDKSSQQTYQENFAQLKEHSVASENTTTEEIATALHQLIEIEKGPAYLSLMAIKQQAVAFYLSTEEVSKNILNHLPIPGEYEGCITTESVNNKAWA